MTIKSIYSNNSVTVQNQTNEPAPIFRLPVEIWHYIAEFVMTEEHAVKNVVHFGQTCKLANAVIKDVKIQRAIFNAYVLQLTSLIKKNG